MKDLHILPKVRDSLSYLYVEHCRIDQDAKAIALHDARGKTPVPCAALMVLMLGPGTTITHAAVKALADNGCLVMWTGEEGVRFYAQGLGETRQSRNLRRQVTVWADISSREEVVRRLYGMRFGEVPGSELTLPEIRGKEGIRVRAAYAAAAKEWGVEWRGRDYRRNSWSSADSVNRALSAANSCLYAVCHAAIVSAGYSTALGFIHTGKMLSFVYDVADLYKTDVSVPVAFRIAAESDDDLEGRVRRAFRDVLRHERILEQVVPDIRMALGVVEPGQEEDSPDFDADEAAPGDLWDPKDGCVPGGKAWASEPGGKTR